MGICASTLADVELTPNAGVEQARASRGFLGASAVLGRDDGSVPPKSEPPVAVAPLFDAERSMLLRLLEGLDDADWHRPTPCPAWTVLGLAYHLLGDDLGLLARRRDSYLGTPSPADVSDYEFIDWLDNLQIEWVRAARRLSPRLVVELLQWTQPRLVEVLAAEDLTVRSARVSWAGHDPVPVWLDQLRELSEYWIHRQQLLDALERPTELDPEFLRPILLGLRWAYPYRLSNVEAADGTTIRFKVGAPINESWFLVAHARGWDFHDAPGEHTVADVTMAADQAWRLLTNNLRQPETPLDITGDERLVDMLRNTRAIIGHPQ